MKVLGINAVFHDPAAALVEDGRIVAAAEEERFSRRKHGKTPVPFSTWELPEQALRWCLAEGGVEARDLDAIAYSYDPALARASDGEITDAEWEGLRTLYAERAPRFLASILPDADPERFRWVPHHLAHAASAFLAAPAADSACLVLDGRGERASHLAGAWRDGTWTPLAAQELPHSLGLLYEELTAHLGFRRSSDEYKVMALAAYGKPRFLAELRELVRPDGAGGFVCEPVDWKRFCPPPRGGEDTLEDVHADLACSVQQRTEEMILALAEWLHEQTGQSHLTLAGGVALNCVANSRIWREGPFETVWVQPASGDSGTALGAALWTAHELGDPVAPMGTAALGRGFSDEELGEWLRRAELEGERPDDIAEAVAEVLADGGVVAWFQGRSEFGPRALGHRSLLCDPRRRDDLERMNDIKGREQFRPIAPMVLAERAHELFDAGPIPSEYMLFTHRVKPKWRDRIPAVTHVDGSARIQTVAAEDEPVVARMLAAFERRTGVPVVVNTSLNTAGRPMVDDPRDALECFGSGPIAALALGPYLVRRPALSRATGSAAPAQAAAT